MGGFSDPILDGTGNLTTRAQEQSPNYQTGVSGWIIRQDGTVEFNSGTFRGTVTASTFLGTNFVINASGAFFYSGTPAAGNLIASIASAAGTDAYGNAYPQGFMADQGGKIIAYKQGTSQTAYASLDTTFQSLGLLMQPNTARYPVTGSISCDDGLGGGGTPELVMGPPRASGQTAPILLMSGSSVDGTVPEKVTIKSTVYNPTGFTQATGTIMADTGWTALTLAAPYERKTGFHTPAYNVLSGGLVKLRGGLDKSTAAALVTGEIPFTLPGSAGKIWPLAQESFICGAESGSAGQTVRLDLGTNGAATIVFNQTGYTPHWLSLDGIVYSLV